MKIGVENVFAIEAMQQQLREQVDRRTNNISSKVTDHVEKAISHESSNSSKLVKSSVDGCNSAHSKKQSIIPSIGESTIIIILHVDLTTSQRGGGGNKT